VVAVVTIEKEPIGFLQATWAVAAGQAVVVAVADSVDSEEVEDSMVAELAVAGSNQP
jgi:hypothetical protein